MSDNQLVLYYPCRVGGAPDAISRQIAKYVVKNKHTVRYDINLLPGYTPSPGVHTPKLEIPSELRKVCTIVDLRKFRTLIKSHKNVLVHIPKTFLFAPDRRTVLAFYAYFKCEGKLITNCHGPVRTVTLYKFWNREIGSFLQFLPSCFLYPSLLKLSGTRIVHSPFMQNHLRKKYGLSSYMIPLAIENWWFESNDVAPSFDGDPIFFYHGKLAYEKGVDLLVAAFAKLKRNYKKAKLYVAGSGPLQNTIMNYSIEHGLKDSILLLGRISNETLRTCLRTADAAIYPSRYGYEGFCMAGLEALASAGGHVALSKYLGLTGFLQDQFEEIITLRPLIDCIYEVLVALSEGTFSGDIIHLQKNFASRFTWDKIIHTYIQLYNDLEQS